MQFLTSQRSIKMHEHEVHFDLDFHARNLHAAERLGHETGAWHN